MYFGDVFDKGLHRNVPPAVDKAHLLPKRVKFFFLRLGEDGKPCGPSLKKMSVKGDQELAKDPEELGELGSLGVFTGSGEEVGAVGPGFTEKVKEFGELGSVFRGLIWGLDSVVGEASDERHPVFSPFATVEGYSVFLVDLSTGLLDDELGAVDGGRGRVPEFA